MNGDAFIVTVAFSQEEADARRADCILGMNLRKIVAACAASDSLAYLCLTNNEHEHIDLRSGTVDIALQTAADAVKAKP